MEAQLAADDRRLQVNCVEDEKRLTALYWAAQLGHAKVVRVLLADQRVDVNFKSRNGQTALHTAAERGQDEVVQLLLSSDRVDVNAKDVLGVTPMFYAIRQKHLGIMELLLADSRLADGNLAGVAGGCALRRAAATAIVKAAAAAEDEGAEGKAAAEHHWTAEEEAAGNSSEAASADSRKGCWLCHKSDNAVELSVCKGCKKVSLLLCKMLLSSSTRGL